MLTRPNELRTGLYLYVKDCAIQNRTIATTIIQVMILSLLLYEALISLIRRKQTTEAIIRATISIAVAISRPVM